MKTSVKLEGFKELEVAIQQIEKRATQKAVMRRALKNAAQPIADKANNYAEIGPTGRLSESVIVGTKVKNEAGNVAYSQTLRAGGTKGEAVAAMRSARRGNSTVEMFVGPVVEAFYARFVEFGTAPHINGGRFAGTMNPGTPPRPFLRPAWDSEQEAVLDRVGAEMWSEISKAVARAAKRKAK